MPFKKNCHCGSHKNFDECCNIYISSVEHPKTAEQLMRSRFTAFKLRAHQYLIDTHLSKNKLNINNFDNAIVWLGLIILPPEYKNDSYVEFVAFYKLVDSDKIEQLHEYSYFEKINDQWIYISGKPLSNIKLNRNEPCFCGSGKKVKKCHPI